MKDHCNEISCFREGFYSFGERSNVEIGHLMKEIVLKSAILVNDQEVFNWMHNRQKINCFRIWTNIEISCFSKRAQSERSRFAINQ